MNRTEALAKFQADRPRFEELGIVFHGARSYLPDEYRRDWRMAMDQMAQDAPAGTLSTDPNSAVPAILTTYIDPERYEILFAPTSAALVLGEVRKADWLAEVEARGVTVPLQPELVRDRRGGERDHGGHEEHGQTVVHGSSPFKA